MVNPKGASRLPEVAEFQDVRLGDDGIWRGQHIRSGRQAAGVSWAHFLGRALVIRVVEGLRRSTP